MAVPAPCPPRIHDAEGVRTIAFDRPDALNAVTPDDLAAAVAALREAEDGAAAAVVFTGAGERAFCAGMHLTCFEGLTPATARALITQVRDFLQAVRTSPLPTAAAVNGHCIGIAFELALACDLRIAVPGAKYGLPEVAVGVPSIADAALLQQHLGLSAAKELILTGDLWEGAALEGSGFFNRIVERGELYGAAAELLGRITRHEPRVIAAQKRLFETWQNTGLRDGAEVSIGEFARVFE